MRINNDICHKTYSNSLNFKLRLKLDESVPPEVKKIERRLKLNVSSIQRPDVEVVLRQENYHGVLRYVLEYNGMTLIEYSTMTDDLIHRMALRLGRKIKNKSLSSRC